MSEAALEDKTLNKALDETHTSSDVLWGIVVRSGHSLLESADCEAQGLVEVR